MTPLQAIAVAVRLFAIWLGLSLFAWVPSAWSYFRWGSEGTGSAISAAGAITATAATALFLWFFPVTVARKLLPGSAPEEPAPASSSDEWFLVGARLIGLWTLTRAVPTLIFLIAFFYWSVNPHAEPISNAPTKWSLVTPVLQAVLGLWLLFSARGLLGLLRLARRTGGGIPPESVNESGDTT